MTLAIGEVSEQTGVSVARLEHWRRSGLVVPSARNGSGKHWRYTERDVVRVRVVLELLGHGASMADVWRRIDDQTARAFHAEQSRTLRDLTD